MKNTIKFIAIAILAGISFLNVSAQEQTIVTNTEGSATAAKAEKKAARKTSSDDSWTGFYVGGFGGYSNIRATPLMTTPDDNVGHFSQNNARIVNTKANPKLSANTFNGGGTFGYNHQKGRLVVGAEVDFGANRINKSVSTTGRFPSEAKNLTITHSVKTDWLMTARPRVGMAFKKAVIYATGGLAVTNIKYSGSYSEISDIPPGRVNESSNFTKTKAGFAVGAGVEAKITNRWSVKGEYLVSQFGRSSLTSNNMQNISNSGNPFTTPDESFTRSTNLKSHSVRFGVNYRF